jgi:class 3 adenylate cyclase
MANAGKTEKKSEAEYTVLIFDICSSTIFIEDLVKTDELDSYCKLLEDFKSFLTAMNIEGMIIYKFLGDGFIILFDKKVLFDEVLMVSRRTAEFAKERIARFIKDNIETTVIPRIGITIGIDIGNLKSIKLYGETEFIGRAINVSSRLQSSLKDKEHVNKILMSVKAYKKIIRQDIKRKCIERERVFRNISDNNRTRCYELDSLDI